MANSRMSIRYGGFWTCSALILTSLAPSGVSGQTAQHAFGTGAQFQSYSFSEGLGTEVATLALIPVAYSLPVGENFDLEFYSAFANGSV